MAVFILKTFSVQDEEIQTIHLPVVFSAIVEALDVSTQLSLFFFQTLTRRCRSSM
jgi:hypothetical protein